MKQINLIIAILMVAAAATAGDLTLIGTPVEPDSVTVVNEATGETVTATNVVTLEKKTVTSIGGTAEGGPTLTGGHDRRLTLPGEGRVRILSTTGVTVATARGRAFDIELPRGPWIVATHYGSIKTIGEGDAVRLAATSPGVAIAATEPAPAFKSGSTTPVIEWEEGDSIAFTAYAGSTHRDTTIAAADLGTQLVFDTRFRCGDDLVYDFAGKGYRTREINGRCWTAEAVMTNTDSAGEPLTTSQIWQDKDRIDWWYEEGEAWYKASWDYDWDALADLEDSLTWYNYHAAAKSCPVGWELPEASYVDEMMDWIEDEYGEFDKHWQTLNGEPIDDTWIHYRNNYSDTAGANPYAPRYYFDTAAQHTPPEISDRSGILILDGENDMSIWYYGLCEVGMWLQDRAFFTLGTGYDRDDDYEELRIIYSVAGQDDGGYYGQGFQLRCVKRE